MLFVPALCAVLGFATAIPDGALKPRKITQQVKEPNLVVFNSTTPADSIWFSFMQFFGYTSFRINSTAGEKAADFRLTPMKIIEFNDSIPIDQSTSQYSFDGKQSNWGAITVETLKEKIDKKDTTIFRMNATLSGDNGFRYAINAYITDRACFYGNYNLDPDAMYIVQTITGFPYKYQNSTIAVEQVVASRDSGSISTFLAMNSASSSFLGSLVISPEAHDSKLGSLTVSTSDFVSVNVTVQTTNMAKESDFERIYVALGSDQQPSDVTFEEKFGVSLSSVSNNGTTIPTIVQPSAPTGSADSSGASAASAGWVWLLALLPLVAL